MEAGWFLFALFFIPSRVKFIIEKTEYYEDNCRNILYLFLIYPIIRM